MKNNNEQLSRKKIKWERADYGKEKTGIVVKRPFSVSFAHWAGKNGLVLRQTDRIDSAAAQAYARGMEDGKN